LKNSLNYLPDSCIFHPEKPSIMAQEYNICQLKEKYSKFEGIVIFVEKKALGRLKRVFSEIKFQFQKNPIVEINTG